VLLAVVFGTAGVGKLMDLEGSQRSIQAFGIRDWNAYRLGTALPFVELTVALLLIFRPTAQAGAALAVLLLAVFVAAIANALNRGLTPDCNCFGALHSSPAGRNTVGRNAVLGAIALFGLIEGPGPTIDGWVADKAGAVVASVGLALLGLIMAVTAFSVWRRDRALTEEVRNAHRAMAQIPPGLPVGTLAPDFDVPDVDGGRLTLTALRERGKPIMLVFTAPGCGPCEGLMPDIDQWRTVLAERFTFAVIGRGTTERVKAQQATANGDHLPDALTKEVLALGDLMEEYRLVGTPSAVILTPEGFIAGPTADGHAAIEALVRVGLERTPARIVEFSALAAG
jgi:thiol-disulfide isomerase/thioredoxin/uncharacterized membrane protein YphA (DoxX/SURF4 family)